MTAGVVGPVVLVSYVLLVLVIGWFYSRGQGNPEDFWVAGRSFGVPILVMANVGSLLHGGAILSHVGFAAHVGGVAVTTSLSYALGFATIFYLSFVLDEMPLMPRPPGWYLGSFVLTLAFIAAPALYGFWISQAGRQLFHDEILERAAGR